MADEPETRKRLEGAGLDLVAVDDRLLLLERQGDRHRVYLVELQGALSDQTIALAFLEVVFAIFLALTLWDHYKEAARPREVTP